MEDTLTEHKLTIHFATTNKHKFEEAARIVATYGIQLKLLALEKHEIQSDRLDEIAEFAASEFITKRKVRSVLAEDSGFFVDTLKGFPGPYSSYVFKKIGSRGVLRLLGNANDRKASFKASVAYCEIQRAPISFTGIINGIVAREPKGTSGFGYDPIFIPRFGDGRTFGEMSMDEKNRFSHRAKAFNKFCDWFVMRKSSSR